MITARLLPTFLAVAAASGCDGPNAPIIVDDVVCASFAGNVCRSRTHDATWTVRINPYAGTCALYSVTEPAIDSHGKQYRRLYRMEPLTYVEDNNWACVSTPVKDSNPTTVTMSQGRLAIQIVDRERLDAMFTYRIRLPGDHSGGPAPVPP
jgi:hypothetical protein